MKRLRRCQQCALHSNFSVSLLNLRSHDLLWFIDWKCVQAAVVVLCAAGVAQTAASTVKSKQTNNPKFLLNFTSWSETSSSSISEAVQWLNESITFDLNSLLSVGFKCFLLTFFCLCCFSGGVESLQDFLFTSDILTWTVIYYEPKQNSEGFKCLGCCRLFSAIESQTLHFCQCEHRICERDERDV